jgi:hypothetical protein
MLKRMMLKGLCFISVFAVLVSLLLGCEKTEKLTQSALPIRIDIKAEVKRSLLENVYYIMGISVSGMVLLGTYSRTAQAAVWKKVSNPWFCVPVAVATGAAIGLNYKYNCANDDDDEDTVKTKSKVKPSPTPSPAPVPIT